MENPSLLPPESPDKLFDLDGGSYYAWTSLTFPFLGVAKVSGSIFALHPLGFAPPHYADCSKIGYVIQGDHGVAGLVCTNTMEEKVVKLRQGDTIVVPIGLVSWWLNAGNDELQIIFLADTPHPNSLGEFTINYCFLTGARGILGGFSRKTICKTFDINDEQANRLITNSQTEGMINKLDSMEMADPSNDAGPNLSLNVDEIAHDVYQKNGGYIKFLTVKKQPSLDGIKLCAKFMKLEPNAMFGPTYYAGESGVQLSYVVKGSCRVEIVDLTGKGVLDTHVSAGQIFVVPKFYVVSIVAAEEGLECFSIITSSEPVLGQLAGKTSFWKALTPSVLQASLNIDPQFYDLLSEKLEKSTIVTPSN